jgi:hypothetical protein
MGEAVIRQPGEGERHSAGGRSAIVVKAGADETGGSFFLSETSIDPGFPGPPPHRRRRRRPTQSSGGRRAVTGAGSVGTGSTSLARSGGGVNHKTPSGGSSRSGGTGTVSGGNDRGPGPPRPLDEDA